MRDLLRLLAVVSLVTLAACGVAVLLVVVIPAAPTNRKLEVFARNDTLWVCSPTCQPIPQSWTRCPERKAK